MQTNLTIIFNTHMPHVISTGELFDEPENWLFEAITETYIPLFRVLANWDHKLYQGKKVIFSMTPCLFNQLANCKDRYIEYLKIMQKIAIAETERSLTSSMFTQYERWNNTYTDEQMQNINDSAHWYLKRINDSLDFMKNHDIVEFLKDLVSNKSSHIELWTSTPDHNFLPFFEKKTSDYFIQRGVDLFTEVFGRQPDGFWLPECAFRPGVEDGLIKAGIRQTALTPHAIEVYHPEIKSGLYQHGDLKLLVHDYRLAMHIWKTEFDTFPSNHIYREFYRDMGFDVAATYFDEIGVKIPEKRRGKVWTGIKYHASTDGKRGLGYKNTYDIAAARKQVIADAATFYDVLEKKRDLVYDRKNFILAFDTELFGHWWHEGVFWLENVLNHDLTVKAGVPA